MKKYFILLTIIIILGVMFVSFSQANIPLVFWETKDQKEDVKPEQDIGKEKSSSRPTIVQQPQSVDRTNTNQTQSPGDEMSQQISTSAGDVPPGYSSELIDVKFREGTDVDPPEDALPPDLRDAVASIRRGFSLSEEELRRIGAGKMRSWFRITLKPDADSVYFLERIKRLESVEHAEFVPLPPPPPSGN